MQYNPRLWIRINYSILFGKFNNKFNYVRPDYAFIDARDFEQILC